MLLVMRQLYQPHHIVADVATSAAAFSIQSSIHEARVAANARGMIFPIEGADDFSILAELRRPGGTLVDVVRRRVKSRWTIAFWISDRPRRSSSMLDQTGYEMGCAS